MKAVVFDFGGVMTTTTMPERVKPVVDRLGLSWETIEAGFGRYRRLMDGGFLTLGEMYELIFADAALSLSPEVIQQIVDEDEASFLYRNEKTLEWMKSLKARGYKLGILTNMPPAFARRFRETFADFIALADALVISGEERMFKPQERIYALLAARLGLPGEELVFVDDVEANCEGARRLGWQAIRFENNEQVARDFDALEKHS